jgi:hypothetical protein
MRPGVAPAVFALGHLAGADNETGPNAERLRTALEISIAGRFGPMLAQDAFWHNGATVRLVPWRPLARRALARHPTVSREELAAATATLHELDEDLQGRELVVATAVACDGPLLMLVACLAPVWAFACRGGLWLRLVGVAVVREDGAEASRRRAVWRSLVSWSPIWFLIAGLAVLRVDVRSWEAIVDALTAHWAVALLAIALRGAGAVWVVIRPERGLQDRLAGTWLVPR